MDAPQPKRLPDWGYASIDKVGRTTSSFLNLFFQGWKIAMLMMKGAYLTQERNSLFKQLGEKVYSKVLQGEFQLPEFQSTIDSLERLRRKMEVEERLIFQLRYGNDPDVNQHQT